MKCILCEQNIKNYNPLFHHLNIDETHSWDICPDCIDKVFKWQGRIYKDLFPTKAMKKRYDRK
ncbi:MAG: hypothetical protein ACP5OA_05225 [Candidatus Woesearchaeota archaeon]